MPSLAINFSYRGINCKAIVRSVTPQSESYLVEVGSSRPIEIKKTKASKGRIWVDESGEHQRLAEEIGSVLDEMKGA